MRVSPRVKTDIGKKGGCFFPGLSKHLHVFPCRAPPIGVDVPGKRADTGSVAQGGIFVVRLLLKDKNKPAPVPPLASLGNLCAATRQLFSTVTVVVLCTTTRIF